MASPIFLDEEVRKQWAHVFEQANKDPERYHNWILAEIEKVIELINRYDKVHVLGYVASKLIKASPNFMTRFFENHDSVDPEEQEYIDSHQVEDDDDVEVLLEYAMNIASAESNQQSGAIPSEENLEEIYAQLVKIKHNVTIYIQAVQEPDKRSLDDHRLRASVMGDTLNIRGQAYHGHFLEVFREMFEPHSGFIQQYYHFNIEDLLNTIQKLDTLVYSKVANVMGGAASHERYIEWAERQEESVIPSISNFTRDNPDLFNEEAPENVVLYQLDDVSAFNRIFWIVPQSQIQERIFDQLSHFFGDNTQFFLPPKFKAFPLGDSIIRNKPIIKDNEKYFCFSNHLVHRNIFNITDSLIESADPIYYQHSFRGNTNVNSRDMYLERKVKSLFETMMPKGTFYHSLKYHHNERDNELDVLGIIEDKILIIEVKSGELNIKHRRGAIKGLKDRLEETINEGSFQCHRAESFINENEKSKFQYIDENARKELIIDGKHSIYKVSVTYDQVQMISTNLKYLIDSGVLDPAFKWTWIVSVFDLMIFSELLEEHEFFEYLDYRYSLYDRDDVIFFDEIDILGFYLDGNFPIKKEDDNLLFMTNYSNDIDEYFSDKHLGMGLIEKPKLKKSP